jgi:hypothetical protein
MRTAKLLSEHLRDPGSSWSMGSYGAVAEFFQAPDEAIEPGSSSELNRTTPRGGIRIEPRDDMGVCAYEKSTSSGERTQQHIAFCLPADASRMSGARVLTDLGPDTAALREDDRDAVLFDLGVSSLGSGCFQLDFCARIADPGLIGFFRSHCGSDIFEHGSPVFPKLLEIQPHRVVLTRLGRIEVYQPIGGEHTDGKTPEGPHTHLLPDLLCQNRTHAAEVPIRDGWVPCAFLYPETPLLIEPGDLNRPK